MDEGHSLNRNGVIAGEIVEYQKGRKNNRKGKWDSKEMSESLRSAEKEKKKTENRKMQQQT